jgi:phycoerythrobilin:ferredoxin oxidoreductase
MTIHVLNFVLFPNPNIRDVSKASDEYVGLPIFGADIVSLPGNKHLVAIDFQPVLPLNDNSSLLPEQYSAIESRLKSIHARYQRGDDAILPWGGDIPPKASRFFSPYALWTRLSEENAIEKVETVVWDAYQEYLDLYTELMMEVQRGVSSGQFKICNANNGDDGNSPTWQGQIDYLEYRRANDPARPMLQRLYGESWTERVIAEVLFPDL